MIRPLVWQVIWVDAAGHGHGACGHRHATADEATLCPFEPEVVPPIGAGLVRQVRDPEYHEPEKLYAEGLRRKAPQLELALEVYR